MSKTDFFTLGRDRGQQENYTSEAQFFLGRLSMLQALSYVPGFYFIANCLVSLSIGGVISMSGNVIIGLLGFFLKKVLISF